MEVEERVRVGERGELGVFMEVGDVVVDDGERGVGEVGGFERTRRGGDCGFVREGGDEEGIGDWGLAFVFVGVEGDFDFASVV